MTTMPSGHVCGAVSVGGSVNIVPSSARSGKVRGWTKHLSWRLEPEVIWFRHESSKPRQFSTVHLIVTATTKHPQNADLPPVLSKRKKRSSIFPKRPKRLPAVWQDPSLRPPGNGLLVEYLIPVAHDVLEAKAIVTKGVELLLKELPVTACRYCSEVHVGPRGHSLRTCTGPQSSTRNSVHEWVKGNINDILVPIEAYHLSDRLAPPVKHDNRFDVDRISAIEELCIQAGVDVLEYPTKRCSEPVQPSTRKRREDASWMCPEDFTYYTNHGSYQLEESSKREQYKDVSSAGAEAVADNQLDNPRKYQIATNEAMDDETEDEKVVLDGSVRRFREDEIIPLVDIRAEDNLQTIAQKTLLAWERMRGGTKKLMTKYRVLVCGYCPEIHIGPRGHRARVCGAFKHQWRDGKHGWQDASLDELIPLQYVWHVRDTLGPPLENALKRFYGKAPAVVELCVNAGAPVPEIYKPLMRLDIAIPTLDESENAI